MEGGRRTMRTPTYMLLVAALAAPAAGQQPVRDSGTAQPTLPNQPTDVVEERPALLTMPRLVYPKDLKRAGVEGRVMVEFILDTVGRAEPQSVTIAETTNSGFNRSAEDFVLAAQFRPGRVGGRAVRVLMRLPIEFNMNAPTDDSGVDSPATADTVYRVEDVEEHPEMVFGPRPEYPISLLEGHIQGRVMIECIIDTLGRVEPRSVKVVQSPHLELTRSVIDQLLKSRFRPARVHGRAVRVRVTLPYDFRVR